MGSLTLALVSVGVGALLGGLVNAILAQYTSFQESKGMARALKAEIDAVLALLALRDYAGDLGKAIARLQNPQYLPAPRDTMNVLVTQDFFITYHALAPKIGLLGEVSGAVAHVYVLAKGLIEDFRTCRDLLEKAIERRSPPDREDMLTLNSRILGLLQTVSTEARQVSDNLGAYAKRGWWFWGLF